MGKKISVFCRNIVCGVVKAALFVSIRTIWRKFFFRNCFGFLSFSDIERKLFGFTFKIFQRCCGNSILRVHRNILRIIFLKTYFLSFSNIEQKIFAILSKTFHRGCKNCFLGVHRYIWRRNSFLKIYILFSLSRTLGQKFSVFCRYIVCWVVKTAFFMSIRTFWRKPKIGFFTKSKKFKSFLEIPRKFFIGVVNTAFSETIGKLCRTFFEL